MNQGVQGKCITTPTRTTPLSKEKGAALGGTRTHNTLLTRQSALPTELPGQLNRQGYTTQHNTRQSQAPIICAMAQKNGTRDYRFLPVWVLLFFGFVPQLLPLLITVVLQDTQDTSLYITAITFSTVAFLCTLLQPYKARLANGFTTGLLITLSILIAIAAAVYDETKSARVEIWSFFLSFVPYCVLWGYIVWRMVKILGSYCCKNQRLRCDGERGSLLLPK